MPLSHPWDNDSTIFHYPKPGTLGIVLPIGRTISIVPPIGRTISIVPPVGRTIPIVPGSRTGLQPQLLGLLFTKHYRPAYIIMHNLGCLLMYCILLTFIEVGVQPSSMCNRPNLLSAWRLKCLGNSKDSKFRAFLSTLFFSFC